METHRPTLAGDAIRLIVALLLSFAAAAIGSAATIPNLQPWYASLQKPSWNPPNAVFGPVWSTLYTLMGIAAWLVWRRGGTGGANVKVPLAWFLLQLVLNAIWSWLFFGWHQVSLAFLEVLLLWLTILATILSFRRVSSLAAMLLVPYLLWVSFASTLNGAIARLN